MKKRSFLVITCICLTVFVNYSYAQVVNTATIDTNEVNLIGKVNINAYIDAYYGYDLNNPKDNNRPYAVSSARHNEFTINLAYIDLKYASSRIRGRFVPGLGTYINANYTHEPGVLKNIVEASLGVKVFKNKDIWIDAGVFGSPYTNESAISKDHLIYTRSFAPEYVPYYLSGIKSTLPLGKKVTAYLYLLNGWQLIQDNNSQKSIGTQLEIRPTPKLLINWNTYIGDERSMLTPNNRMRYFSDLYIIWQPTSKLDMTACMYYGIQERVNDKSAPWFTANTIARYKITQKTSLAGRIEYFEDPQNVHVLPITAVKGFSSYSASLGVNINALNNMLIRFEGRDFFSTKQVYIDSAGNPTTSSILLISSMAIWF